MVNYTTFASQLTNTFAPDFRETLLNYLGIKIKKQKL